MPLFALANAGVGIEVAGLRSPVAIGVATGLVLGKPIGIVAFSWIATRIGMASLMAPGICATSQHFGTASETIGSAHLPTDICASARAESR